MKVRSPTGRRKTRSKAGVDGERGGVVGSESISGKR